MKAQDSLKPGMPFIQVVQLLESTQMSDLDVIIRSDGCNPDYELGRETGPLYIKFWKGPYDPSGPYTQQGYATRSDFTKAIHDQLTSLTACQKFIVLMTRHQGMGNMDIFELQFDKAGNLVSATEPEIID
jgi:hypothetical protein